MFCVKLFSEESVRIYRKYEDEPLQQRTDDAVFWWILTSVTVRTQTYGSDSDSGWLWNS